MTSFQISLSPSRRAAGRFVAGVRRVIQKAYAEEHKRSGLTQSDLARAIGVHRSVISRQIRGYEDISLSRVAELAFAMGRKPVLELSEPTAREGSNTQQQPRVQNFATSDVVTVPSQDIMVTTTVAAEAA